MGGSVKFEDALAMRLNIMQPSEAKLRQFLKEHPAKLSPGARVWLWQQRARAPRSAAAC